MNLMRDLRTADRLRLPMLHLSMYVIIFITVLLTSILLSSIQAHSSTMEKILTPDELEWLESHRVVRVAGPRAFPPFSFYSEKEGAKGISVDYLELIASMLNISIEQKADMPWAEVLKKAEKREIDLLSCAVKTSDRDAYLVFSKPYLSFPLVIIRRKDAPFIVGIEDLKGSSMAFVNKTATYEWIQRDGIDLIRYFADTPLDALRAVSLGLTDSYIDNLASVTYLIEKNGIANLKIAAPTNYDNQRLYFAVRSDWPQLGIIINRCLDSIESEELAKIRNRWLSVRYEYGISPQDVIKWALIFLIPTAIVFTVIILSNRGLKREIAHRRLIQEEREKLQSQLSQIRKLESIGRLAGGVAHDFNNMLGVILGHTEMAIISTHQENPVYNKLVQIKNAAERSASLTRQLLAYARKQPIAPKVVDLNETVEGMLSMLQRVIGENIDVSWIPGKELWLTKVDPSQLDQISTNLCVNARDSIEGVGKITIETGNVEFDGEYCSLHPEFTEGEYVMLAVSDDGCGMDKETLERIFEPFFTTKEMGKGTGLGLATIYGIVRQNRGFINVYSEPGVGTTFRIYLPRHLDKAVQKGSPVIAVSSTASGRETILLVEDDRWMLEMTSDMLEHMGYRVLAASRPGNAIEIAGKHEDEIDLLITDVIMPEMNGKELAEKLISINGNMKKLFMSGYTENVIARHGVLDEGVHFIQKPFSLEDLAVRVRVALK